jgi:hypothetical protein
MTFLIAWVVLLMLFLTVAVYRGYKNKVRIKNISRRMKSVETKINDIWQRPTK